MSKSKNALVSLEVKVMDFTEHNGVKTMCSLDLAKFCIGESKDAHSDFVKKMKKVLGEVGVGNFSDTYLSKQNKKLTCYYLPERESCLMAMSYSYELQAQVYDQWKALEMQQPTLPATYKEALLCLVEAEEEKEALLLENKSKTEELTIAAPKVKFFEQVSETTGLSSMGNVAKAFGVGRNKMFAELRKEGVLQGNNVPYQSYVNSGYFEVKESVGFNHISYTTYVTGKGQTYLHKKLKKSGFIYK